MVRRNMCHDCMKIDEISGILRTVAPEMIDLLENRYNILKVVGYLQPIGRRSLSGKLDITERVIRKEANILKDQGLLDFSMEGMKLTPQGEAALSMLKLFFHDLKGIKSLEEKLAEKLGIRKVVLAPFNEDEEDENFVIKDIGKLAAEYLRTIIEDDSIIGITGGSSVYNIIESYRKEKIPYPEVTVIPARGGLGTKSEYQANTLVEKLADKLGSKYQLLFTPDILAKDTIDSLRNEPHIKDILEKVENIDILVFGIGQAMKMAERRSLTDKEKGIISEKGAVSEAFGYYFNKDGNIVHELSTIGIELDKFKEIDKLIAVAGGTNKAEAIISICKLNPNLVLVTDERVARTILKSREEE